MQIFTQTILIVQYNKKQLSAVWPDVQTPKIQGKGYHTIKFTKYNLIIYTFEEWITLKVYYVDAND